MRTGLTLVLLGCAEPPPTAVPLDPPPCPTFAPGEVVGTVPSPPASEISGVAVDPDGRLFVHNDSGEAAAVHVLAPDGTPLGTWTLTDVDAIDFEDIAIGPGPDGTPYVWVGDIGDNAAARPFVTIYRFPLPLDDGGDVVPERFDVIYGDGPRDAETLFVDHAGNPWIASKETDGATGLYRLLQPRPGPRVVERLFTLPFGEPPLGQTTLVTGGDWSDAGLVLRTYLQSAYVWPAHPGEEVLAAVQREPCPVTLRAALQPEAVAWGLDGLVTIAEGTTPTVDLHRRR